MERWILLLAMACLAWQDIRTRQVMLPVVGTAILTGLSIRTYREGIEILWSAGFGFSISVGILMLAVARLWKDSIGEGDGWVLCMTGVFLNVWENLEVFLYGLLLCAAASLVLIGTRKAGRKTKLPFVPFLLLGYLVVLITGNC